MNKRTISFRLESRKVSALDSLAEALDRDRSYLLNDAISAYLELQQWQLEQIKEGQRQADAGRFVDHKKVKKLAARWRKR
jgi:predicted transcriptional regulator